MNGNRVIIQSMCIALIVIIGLAIPIIICPQEATGVSIVTVSSDPNDNPDYPTITAAINDNQLPEYQTILVEYGLSGYYEENIDISRSFSIYGDNSVCIVGDDTAPAVTISNDSVQFHDISVRTNISGTKTQPGIKVDAGNCNIYKVLVQNCYVGIELGYNQDGTTVEDCTLYSNSYAGLTGNVNNYCTIRYNEIRANGEYGMYFYVFDNSSIVNNYFKNHADYGAYFDTSCKGNDIYHNNFEDNSENSQDNAQAYDDNDNANGNRWDDDEEDGGNYWLDDPNASYYNIDGGLQNDTNPSSVSFNAGPR